jgi:hypothetical protein
MHRIDRIGGASSSRLIILFILSIPVNSPEALNACPKETSDATTRILEPGGGAV